MPRHPPYALVVLPVLGSHIFLMSSKIRILILPVFFTEKLFLYLLSFLHVRFSQTCLGCLIKIFEYFDLDVCSFQSTKFLNK